MDYYLTVILTGWTDSVAISIITQYSTQLQESFRLGIGLALSLVPYFVVSQKAIFPMKDTVASTFVYFVLDRALLECGE